MDHLQNANIIYLVVLLCVLIAGFIANPRHHERPIFQYALVWILIIMVLLLGYSFKDRFVAELVPSRAVDTGGQIVIGQSKDDHYYVDVLVNGKSIKFLIDTGASDIVLNMNDAQAVGLDLKRLEFNKIYNTANGQVRGASAQVGSMKIGKLELKNVSVSINEGELDVSLLGMSFLERFKSYKFDNDKLYLEY